MKIVLYSTNCPKCKILKTKLDKKGLQYETNTDVELMINKGMKSAPYLEVGENLMGFSDAIQWINAQEG